MLIADELTNQSLGATKMSALGTVYCISYFLSSHLIQLGPIVSKETAKNSEKKMHPGLKNITVL